MKLHFLKSKKDSSMQSKSHNEISTLNKYLVSNRQCGECHVCCDVLHINEGDFKKPANNICHNYNGLNCNIYDQRPKTCKDWYCLWRQVGWMNETTRPDILGVMFSIERTENSKIIFEKIYIVCRALNDADDFQKPEVQQIIRLLKDEGSLPIWLSYKAKKQLIYPNNIFADAISRPFETPYQSQLINALKWRDQYDRI